MEWMIHQAHTKLVYSPEQYEIDLRRLASRADLKAVLRELEGEPFATSSVVSEAQELLTNYLAWLQAQEKVRRLRGT